MLHTLIHAPLLLQVTLINKVSAAKETERMSGGESRQRN